VYLLLIVVTAGISAGRLLAVQLVYEPSLHRPADRRDLPGRAWPKEPPKAMPTFSSNDRSRWATIRALVDEGTYVIGRRDPALVSETNKYGDTGIIFEDGWGSVDKVLHPERLEYYSSKPPLLSTVLAGEYWLLQRLFGWTLVDNSWEVVRVILITVNWLPLIIYLYLLSQLVDRLGMTDWGRLLVMTAACFGTFLTTFITSLNNHTIAAFSVLFAIYPCVAIWNENRVNAWRFIVAGFFAAWTACNELPAAAFGVVLFVLLLIRDPLRALLWFVPAALLPIVLFLATNYAAVGSIVPVQAQFGNQWYNYEGSHWLNIQRNPTGIDAADDPKPWYAFHLLLGHHGFFSLSPIFLLSLAGMVQASWSKNRSARILALATMVVSVAVFVFYLAKTNNYGGWSSGPRWFFWLTPLWLLVMLPAADWFAVSRWNRALAYLLLGFSVLSASYPVWNPWRHPSLHNLLEYLHVIRY
jgi:hypothetical protein